MITDSKQSTHLWNRLARSRNLLLGGLGIAALAAVLATSSDGFGQPETKAGKTKAAAPAGAGLKGMLPDEVPDSLVAEEFDPLGKDWLKWGEQVSENLMQLYSEEVPDAAAQRKALVGLKAQLATLLAASSKKENAALQDAMVGIHGRLGRRVDTLTAALDTLEADPKTAHTAQITAANSSITSALAGLRKHLGTYQNGLVWLGYVRADAIAKAIKAGDNKNAAFAAVQGKLANTGKLLKSQQEFLVAKPFATLQSSLAEQITLVKSGPKNVNVAALRTQLKALLGSMETYEATNSVKAAGAMRTAFDNTRGLAADGGAAIAEAMRSHYVNYNFRIYISEQFMNRTLGESRTERRPVNDFILGASVSGNSTTVARVTIDLKKSSNNALMDIVLSGRTNSNTVAVTSQATIWTSGNHTFNARQRVIFDGDKLTKTGNASISVNANNTTTGIRTSMGNFPILGGIANGIARGKVADKRGQSEAIARQKVREQVLPEFKKEIKDTLAESNKNLADNVIAKLKEADMWPEARSIRTTDHYLLLAARIMKPTELSGGLTNPTEPPGRGLTVRMHESLMNNAVDKIGLAGRKLTADQIKEELKNAISDFLGDNYDADLEKSGAKPMGVKKPSTDKFVFDPDNPIRLRVRNGKLHIVIRCGLEQAGKAPIPMQIITVPLSISIVKDKISVKRGTVSVAPATRPSSGAKQIIRAGVMRKKIESAIPDETRERTLTFDRKGKKPLKVLITKISSVNGWLTIWAN